MSNMVNGMVQAITPMNGVSKRTNKPYTIWTVTVDGQEVKAGFKKPGFEVGQVVSIPTSTNKWGDVEMIQPGTPTGGYTPPPGPISAPGGSGGTSYTPAGRTFPVGRTSPEMSIIRQNALTNANAAVHNYFAEVYEHNEDPSFPSTFDDYVALIMGTAYKFTDFSSGQREVKAVESMGKASA